MSTTSSSTTIGNNKDRKRSAHWTDLDTEQLVNLLLKYKNSGRTADNGFKPEIWEEASLLLENNTYMGGPKTPDACKSRWQRLQRDYKAAKDMEAMPGFAWDRTTNRLSASPECWINAEKQLDSYKYRKIHLPTFDSIAILCTGDSTRSRPRVQKGRSSLGSISNASSMLSLSTNSTSTQPLNHNQNQNQNQGQSSADGNNMNQIQQQQQQHHLISGNGNGNVQNSSSSSSSNAITQLQQVQNDQNVFNWSTTTTLNPNNSNSHTGQDGIDDDGEGEFDSAFNLSGGSQSFNLGQKRPLPFDPSILSPTIHATTNQGPGPPSSNLHTLPHSHSQHNLPIPQGSPPKKPRQTRSNGNLSSNHIQPPQQQTQMHQQIHQQHHQHQHHLPPAHTIPQQYYLAHTHAHQQPPPNHPSTTQIQNGTGHSNLSAVPRSPEFTTSTQSLLDPSIIQTPPPSSNPNSNTNNPQILRQQFTPISNGNNGGDTPNTSMQNHLQQQQQQQHHLHHHPFPGNNGNGLSNSNSIQSLNALSNNNNTPSISTPVEISNHNNILQQSQQQVQQQEKTESERRTEAIIQIQKQQEQLNLNDENLIEILIEFENNINAVDTFLAIEKDNLKTLWLNKIIKRRSNSLMNFSYTSNSTNKASGNGNGTSKKS
ncbi:uncharacterized protein L201_006843 [Kwoniella dendrophila CBS 6074]|uniref:Myb-like domain-containing protein n=1 Tax=Kwoniella dendrophila CBS 6074 TaxID=1295534 RepID=A0AAX4K3Z2_9TREE